MRRSRFVACAALSLLVSPPIQLHLSGLGDQLDPGSPAALYHLVRPEHRSAPAVLIRLEGRQSELPES